jgi:predicted nucleic acid-binding protein
VAVLFWDASALGKRYFGEVGSDTVNALFAHTHPDDMVTTPWGYVETYSILLRRLNAGALDSATFSTVVTAMQREVAQNPGFAFLSIDDAAIFASIPTMRAHNLNATDAAILTLLLEHSRTAPPGSPRIVLVASDHRLLRAAQLEGFAVINPETLPAADAPSLLAGL